MGGYKELYCDISNRAVIMVVKKKTAKVETVALDNATLEKLTASLSVDGSIGAQRLSQNLLECLHQTDPVLQIQQVKKVGSLFEELTEECSPPDQLLVSCLDTLAVMYASLHAKNPLKRAIASTWGCARLAAGTGGRPSVSVLVRLSVHGGFGPLPSPHGHGHLLLGWVPPGCVPPPLACKRGPVYSHS
ncbi:hypothetical protein AAFF_G00141570 [Aldrovandia affinis]|uniref:Uncharacterized protein n=1 Tax=Aldrovandia affinis TaxID=143900 RepID=A0AAD7TCV0_9TELE|nr:hypothetical protein AAFF_G00141570 [Aldrovandia affinis]